MATIAIGDIHGNLRALDDLFKQVNPDVSGADTIVFLGDYVDRGADSKGRIERILDFRQTRSYSPTAAAALRKEMEQLGMRLILDRVELPYRLFFDAVSPEHIEFLKSLKVFYRTPEAVCVHGGLKPDGGRVEDQEVEYLIWGADDFPEAYRAEDTILYGHADKPVLD